MRRALVKTVANQPAGRAIRIRFATRQLHSRLQDEIASHALPYKLSSIALVVLACATSRDPVLLGCSVVSRVTRARRCATDLAVSFEFPQRSTCGRCDGSRRGQRYDDQGCAPR